MDKIRLGATKAWQGFTYLTTLGFPKSYPIAQFPNLPLIIAFAAGLARQASSGSPRSYFQAVAYLAMTVWAYEELANGSNLFRRLLGAAFVLILVMRVAHAITSP